MTRIATIPLQNSMAVAIQRAQEGLARTQQQIATGKKAQDYADLGSAAPRVLSARSMLARQQAQSSVGAQVGTTLSIYDASLTAIDDAVSGLRTQMMTAIGTGQTTGLQAGIESAFLQFRNSLNTTERGVSLFGGGQTQDVAYKANTLADLVGTPTADLFGNDGVKASAEVAEGMSVRYGVLASDAGSGLSEAFRTLAEAGTWGATPTAAQQTALNTALGQIDSGLARMRAVSADNGRKQAEVETLTTRAQDRAILWQDIVSRNEDADLAQVAVDLTRQQTMLEASYSIFSKLSKLSLTAYL